MTKSHRLAWTEYKGPAQLSGVEYKDPVLATAQVSWLDSKEPATNAYLRASSSLRASLEGEVGSDSRPFR